ncbi:Ldh family oxidoreductase [Oscillochloris sp. ZM17-4]|nr:Ldh family oxidoreductase [Oscillochloris sp. ZM17-4]
MRPGERPALLGTSGAAARVDGRLGWGAPAAQLAAETAIGIARALGAGAATIINGNHIGRVGAYVETIALAGMVGIALCNASQAVAPFGGYGRLMGTNCAITA